MISPQLLKTLYQDSYTLVRQNIEGINRQDSLYQPSYGGNCANWILGHIIVARCNFMMMLDVPSIWDMDRCRQFIPGSNPITPDDEAVPFETLCADFDKTQEQLLEILDRVSDGKLSEMNGEKTIGGHLAFYNAHEAYHAGQLEIVQQVIANKKTRRL